jgi:hypothetical protein
MDPKEQNTAQVDAPTGETKPAVATLIVFGLDDAKKPHASWFDEADAPLAEKAARLMGMKILRLTTDEQRGLAGKLSRGKIFQSGRCFVPYCNRTIFAQLAAMGGEDPPIDPAVVQSALDEPAGERAVRAKPTEAASSPGASSWAAITVGSVVLASEGEKEGWYEAVVTAAKPNHLFELVWRDWPDEKPIVRKRGNLGLLPPAEAAK